MGEKRGWGRGVGGQGYDVDGLRSDDSRGTCRYNTDMGLAALDGNRFKVDVDTIHVLHYTLGPFKPWDFWTGFLITPTKIWVAFR